MAPIEALLDKEFPSYDPLPLGRKEWLDRLVRGILLSEPLAEEFAACFDDVRPSDVDELADSFRFENCVENEDLVAALRATIGADRAIDVALESGSQP
jgi:hypothetical protein